MLLFCFLSLCYAGTIWPGYISNTIANKNQYSDYTIQVVPETNVPVGGDIEIVFPIQYISGLGGKAYCTNCTISGHTVTFHFQDSPILSVANTLYLNNVLNPSQRGGTANFIVRTKRYEFIYDENLIFQTIGIADDISQLTSSIVSSVDSPTAGSLSKYNFAFKTNINLPLGTTIQLFIPKVFVISATPSCSLYSINGLVIEGDVSCKLLTGSRVQVSGFANDITTGSEVGIQVSLTNPSYSQVTDTFTIAAYRYGTSIVYAWKTGINGIQILPGLIKQITLAPLMNVRLATGKIIDYQLTFLPTNPLPAGAGIKIIFPSTFQYHSTQPYLFFKSGLSDISEASPLNMVYDSPTGSIQITNFQATAANKIIIQFRGKNPATSGPSSALDIQTCTDNTFVNIIDENKVDAYVQIENVPSLTFIPATVIPSTSQQTPTDLTFSITPTVIIPGGAYVRVLLDASFYVGTVTAANCISYTTPSNIPSLMCNKSDNLITWQNPTNVQYNVNTVSSFKIINLIQTPTYANDYLVDIEIINSAGTVLQSYTNFITITPLGLRSPTMEFVGPELSDIVVVPPSYRYSIYISTFYNQIIIPEGGYDATKQKAQGRIKFQFPNSLDYNNDVKLGTSYSNGGKIPCKAVKGLLPIDGLSIQCNLYYGISGGTGPYIIMRNFQEVPLNTFIEIHIPNLLNPIATPVAFTITTIQKQYGVDVSLNIYEKINQAFRTQFSLNPGVSVSTMQISNTKLSGVFNLSLDIIPGNDMNNGNDFIVKLPGYDIMFIPDEEVVVCYIDTYLNPCTTYPGVDWILLRIKSPEVHYYTAPVKPRLHLYNLRWPRYSDSVGWVKWALLADPFSSGMNYEVEARTLYYNAGTDKFQAPDVNDFDVAQILSPEKGKGFVGLNFEFYFKTKYLIPDGSQFTLTFPTDFSLDGSYPQAQFSAPQFYSQSATQPLTFSVSGNILTVTNIKEHPASGPFTILVQGVRTSKSPATAQAKPFLAALSVGGKPIVQTQDTVNGFDYFDYGSLFTSGYVIFNSITAFPNNQLEYATYTFTFILSNTLLSGGEISITFPSSYYTTLPIPDVDCRCNVTGALTSFRSCKLWTDTYTIITDQTYTSGEIIFSVDNVLNPLSGKAGLFTITSRYDNVFLDISDNSLTTVRQLYISPKSEPVLVQSIDFAPRNEGEVATYIFKFVPSTFITSAYVVITFPRDYDQRIGNTIICKPYDCTASNREIWVSGVTNYEPLGTNPLIVNVTGVINPNQNLNDEWSGYFAIGVIQQNALNYIDYNAKAGKVQIATAPGWAYLYNVLPSNLYARWANTTYMFNMTSLLYVPKQSSQGSIIIDFPTQFDIPDGSKGCVIYKSTFATTLTCSSTTDSVTVQGNTEDKNGIITFNVTDIANPPDEVTIDEIIVKTYDGFKKQIIEKSYKNLDPWTFTYKFPGPLITINGDSLITVERGTQTEDLWFQVSYPCALDLIFTPTSQLTIIPSQIKLQLTDLQQKFRVSASQSLQPGTYTITWTVSGELSTIPFYTPVKKSTVKVTNNKNIRVYVPTLNEVPVGGNSLDTIVTVDYAPDLGFEILLTSLSTAITLDKRSMQFVAGQNNATFRVSCNATEYAKVEGSNLQISLTLSGINKDVYLLTQTLIDITIISKDTEAPFITGLLNSSTTQTQTDIIFSTGEIAVIYYMVALQGTATPSSNTLLDQGPATYNTTLSQFGKVSLGKTNTATVRIRNLKAQTPYVVYAMAEDRSSTLSDIKSLQFQTADRYNASSFTLTFKQSYLNQAERINIMKYVAFVLSLPTSKVVEKTTYTTQRLLQTASIGLSMYIISIPTTENFPSPLKMITILQGKLNTLSAYVSNLDTQSVLVGEDFTPVYPSFMTKPTQLSSDFTSCIVQGTLDMVGALFVISVQAAQDTASPLAYQVWWGYNSQNLPMPVNWTSVTTPNQAYNLTVRNLTEDTDYNVYMVAGSAHPGYPDISTASSNIVLISCKTKAQQPTTKLDINGSWLLQTSIILIIFI